MTTVRDAVFQMLRERQMTTMFGNPGSTELPMLAEFPDDFRYVLGLHEQVVVGMADGYAQATGRPAFVNLHTAPGVGNAMGGLFNAQANKAPLVVTAGQQDRSLMTLQANLTNRDATRMPHPLVKWSYEPPRAEDVPHAIARAHHVASLPPQGPAFVSIPMDDWHAEVDDAAVKHQTTRDVAGRTTPDPRALGAVIDRLKAAKRPVLVAGPELDSPDGHKAATALAVQQRLPVFASPAPGGGRLGFPEDHPHFQGVLPPAIGPVAEVLAPYDLVLVVGSSVFPYYPNIPGPLLAEGTHLLMITSDPDEASRAPMGDAIVADPTFALWELADEARFAMDRPDVDPRPAPDEVELTDPLNPSTVMRVLKTVLPDDAIIVLEAPSATLALRNQLRLSRPGSYYFGAGGGLGFGLAASLGVQLAQPDRPVVAVLGEGSAQYAIQAFWTAAAYRIPVTFLVLRNEEYAILKWFGMLENVTGAPGLDLPALDVAAVAAGYGVTSVHANTVDELRDVLPKAIAADQPALVETHVAPGMALV